MVPIKAENITTIPSYTALTNPSGTVTAQTLAEAREKGVAKAQVPLYTTAELNHLPADNGLVFVRESATVTGNNQRAADFQSATGGSMSVADSSRDSIDPALVYNNPDSNGNHFVKFDGYEILSDGTVQLIDSKTQLPLWSETLQESTLHNLRRVAESVKQNPNFKVMYEFPDISSQRQAQKFIERNQFDEVIKTRVRGK